jgi:hypothetical protein
VQQDMRYNTSSGSFTVDGLVAYVSASDAIKGQGWVARAALFLQLMAPRYTMLPFDVYSSQQQMQLLALAAADLPAVGRLAAAEVRSCFELLGCCCKMLQAELKQMAAAAAVLLQDAFGGVELAAAVLQCLLHLSLLSATSAVLTARRATTSCSMSCCLHSHSSMRMHS